MALPPGPKGVLRTTWQILNAPEENYVRWLERYGDPFTLRAANGTVVMTARPDEIQRIFSAPPATFGVFAAGTADIITGPESLLLTEEPRHMKARKLLMPPFHGERMRAYRETMTIAAQRALTGLLARGGGNAQDVGQDVTLEIILRAVFGLDDEAALEDGRLKVLEGIETLHPSFVFVKALQREGFGLLPFARYKKAFGEGDAMLQAQIERLRPLAAERDDILSLLLLASYDDGSPMSDSEIKDQLRTLLLAGHETTAITIAWAIYELGRDPDVKAELLKELDEAPDDAATTPLLTAVVKEVLRMHPPVFEVMRRVLTTWNVAGYEVNEGENVAAFIWLAHRNPEVYPEPLRFRPQRFLEKTFGPDVFMPFGGGSRRCIGAAFAQYELEVVLATWLRAFDFTLVSNDEVPAVRRNVTMAPKGGIDFKVTPRARTRVAA